MQSLKKNKILVIDDNEISRSLLRGFLEEIGCIVIETADGDDAVLLACAEHPDLILIDLTLPEENALGTICKIRQKNEISHIPILASAADGSLGIELFSNIDQLGTHYIGYLTKPLSFSELSYQVNQIFFRDQTTD